MLLSVIIPVFNEEEIVAETYRVLEEELKDIEHELIFVNDGSKDRTREIVESLLPGNPNNKIINFSRNFGHQAAFSAGLDHCTGDAVVIIDGDLQDPPSLIHEMLEKWREGYQVVYAQRNKRKGETIFKRFTAFCFYRLIGKLTSIDIPPDTGDFRLLDRSCIEALKRMREVERNTKGMYSWIGFRKKGIFYRQRERRQGTSKWSLMSLVNLALNGITSYTTAPLRLASILGLLVSAAAFIYLIYIIVVTNLYGEPVQGYPTIMVTLLFKGDSQAGAISTVKSSTFQPELAPGPV